MTGLHLGIDVGTQGARASLVEDDGTVVARAARPLAVPAAGPVQEQAPDDWWAAVRATVVDLGPRRREVASIAISCTSGSVCALDGGGGVIGAGLLYADRRAAAIPGTDPSWAVAKISWLLDRTDDERSRAAAFTSPGGFLASRLIGSAAAIDVTQALKFGFDPAAGAWGAVPFDPACLPAVVPTGAPLGSLTSEVAADLGLPRSAVVVAGATDGVAAQLACRPDVDRWAVSIGSTVVWKTVTDRRIDEPTLGVYSHRGPGARWFPGAASSAGARVLTAWATPAELAVLDGSARFTPDAPVAYPGEGIGERFPFTDPAFRPWPAPARSGPERYAAEVLGITLLERWGIEVLVAAGCRPPVTVVTTGGATAASRWMRLRAAVLGVPVEVPAEPSAAYGAAVIAAAESHGDALAASAAMVRTAARVEPPTGTVDDWADALDRFRRRCRPAVGDPT